MRETRVLGCDWNTGSQTTDSQLLPDESQSPHSLWFTAKRCSQLETCAWQNTQNMCLRNRVRWPGRASLNRFGPFKHPKLLYVCLSSIFVRCINNFYICWTTVFLLPTSPSDINLYMNLKKQSKQLNL